MHSLHIKPIIKVNGTVLLPGSKSISNRVLLLAALAHGTSDIRGLLHADDTVVMHKALMALGVESKNQGGIWRINGCGGNFPAKKVQLFLDNSGTAFRFLSGILSFMPGDYQLWGSSQMCLRPIKDLVNALTQAGAQIQYLSTVGFPPLRIQGTSALLNQLICIRTGVSSQFLSGLLLGLPLLKQSATIKLLGPVTSQPYIAMTLNLMARFGVKIEEDGAYFHYLAPAQYQSPGQIFIEGDASAASYFLAAGAIAGGEVTVHGVGKDSIQGDRFFAEVLSKMGAIISWGPDHISAAPPQNGRLKAIDIDLNAIPDAAMTLAVTALFADGTTTIRNIASWRVKETDRLSAMAIELRKSGATVKEGADCIQITPPIDWADHIIIDTYNDHRMAMSLSLIALANRSVQINNPDCVKKTFPFYFDHLKALILQ